MFGKMSITVSIKRYNQDRERIKFKHFADINIFYESMYLNHRKGIYVKADIRSLIQLVVNTDIGLPFYFLIHF